MLANSAKEQLYARWLGTALMAAGALGFLAGRAVAAK